MQRAFADLPLHGGNAPRWLFDRMVKLGATISKVMVKEFGTRKYLRRISDPYWFQAFSCVLGFDWHSSGCTTVTMGALKEALKERDLGIKVAGGKGLMSRKTPLEIKFLARDYSISTKKFNELKYASRMSAKVDNAAVQDSYSLYHHCLVFDEKGNWAVVQQGLNQQNNYARRYHWLGERVEDFVNEPQNAICCDSETKNALNLSARESRENRKIAVDLVKESPKKIERYFKEINSGEQRNLFNWNKRQKEKSLFMPKYINWKLMHQLYNFQPKNYEELLGFNGVGPNTARALALISELVYGEEASWKDPVKYSFAHGGKDGVPREINRAEYDKSIEILEEMVKQTTLNKAEKFEALKRLKEIQR